MAKTKEDYQHTYSLYIGADLVSDHKRAVRIIQKHIDGCGIGEAEELHVWRLMARGARLGILSNTWLRSLAELCPSMIGHLSNRLDLTYAQVARLPILPFDSFLRCLES